MLNNYRLKFDPPSISKQLEIRLLTELATELAIGETQFKIECPPNLCFVVRVAGISKQATSELSLDYKFLHSSGIDVSVSLDNVSHQLLSVSHFHLFRKYTLFGKNWIKTAAVEAILTEKVEQFICLNLFQVRGVSVIVGKHTKDLGECFMALAKDILPMVQRFKPPAPARVSHFQVKDIPEEIKLELDMLTVHLEALREEVS